MTDFIRFVLYWIFRFIAKIASFVALVFKPYSSGSPASTFCFAGIVYGGVLVVVSCLQLFYWEAIEDVPEPSLSNWIKLGIMSAVIVLTAPHVWPYILKGYESIINHFHLLFLSVNQGRTSITKKKKNTV